MDERANDAAAIIEAARATAAPAIIQQPAQPTFFVLPPDHKLVEAELHDYREAPTRAYGTYNPATVDSLVEYVKLHMNEESTTVWVHPTSGLVVSVLDDHEAAGPHWRGHTARLKLLHPPEWTYWLEQDGKMLGQFDFAEHIEGGQNEIVEPDAADVLEMAQSFHATAGVTFRQSTRLASGEQQLQYDEEVSASAGRAGDLTVPSVIMLSIAPFVGEVERQIAARFRFRIREGKLSLGYKLDRPDAIVRDALDQVAQTLRTAFPRVYVGDPPSGV